jgi:hypothetical protein
MKINLTIVILLVGLVSLNGQHLTSDTLIVSEEVIIQAEIQKLTRELDLTPEQQKEIYRLLKNESKLSLLSKSGFPDELLQILSFSQKATLLKLMEVDDRATGEANDQNTLKSLRTLSGGNSVILDDADHIKDVRLLQNNHPDGSHSANTNYSSFKRVCLHAWTYSGSPMFRRTVMKFLLDGIPVGSQITSATLFLYSDPEITSPSSADGNSQLSGSNAFYVERIIEPWDDLTVTWNNQPASTTDGRILFPASTSVTENIQIDLTEMVQTWINTPDLNYGIKMFLQTEVRYRARNYGSMEHENTSIRPRLIINYNTPESTIEYTYDNAGNRVERHVVVIENHSLKSASADEAKSESPKGAVTSEWSDVRVNVFPNPTLGDVSISFEGVLDVNNILYSIYNAMGRKMDEGRINPTELSRLPFANLPKGVYILILRNRDDSRQWKIIKQ